MSSCKLLTKLYSFYNSRNLLFDHKKIFLLVAQLINIFIITIAFLQVSSLWNAASHNLWKHKFDGRKIWIYVIEVAFCVGTLCSKIDIKWKVLFSSLPFFTETYFITQANSWHNTLYEVRQLQPCKFENELLTSKLPSIMPFQRPRA